MVIGDPALLIGVVDGVAVADRGPGLLWDVADRGDHRGELAHRQRVVRAGALAGGDDVVGVERRVAAHHQLASDSGPACGREGVADQLARTAH